MEAQKPNVPARTNRNELAISTRSKAGVNTYYVKKIPGATQDQPSTIELNEVKELSDASATIMQYSKDGSLLALGNLSGISIFSTETNTLVCKIERSNISLLSFSPANKYLLTWERYSSPDNPDNMIVWDISTGESVGHFTQKSVTSDTWPNIKFSDDDSIAARMVNNEIHFFTEVNFTQMSCKLHLDNVSQFSLSPGQASKLKVAAFVPEKKGAPGFVKIFTYPQMNVVSSKSFFKAQEAQLLWNSNGTALLARTHTDVDKTGKSYYGETGLYFLQADGKFESNVILKKEGPIHEVAWSPTGKEFLVIYGFMPSQTTMFNMKCEPLVDFGTAARNTISFSASGRFVCVAGFGNLQGHMDFWDCRKVKKIGTTDGHGTTYVEWSPDSKYFLTATLFPRLRVDNEFKLLNSDGTLKFRKKEQELYQIVWKPIPQDLVIYERSNSPPPRAKAESEQTSSAPKPVGKYVHPNFRGTAGLKKEEEGPVKYKRDGAPQKPPVEKNLPPGYELEDDKKAKKKKNPSKENKPSPNKGGKAEQSSPARKQDEAADVQKKLKLISKKLRQIEDLKELQTNGTNLDPNQLAKVKTEESLREELAQLEKLSLTQ